MLAEVSILCVLATVSCASDVSNVNWEQHQQEGDGQVFQIHTTDLKPQTINKLETPETKNETQPLPQEGNSDLPVTTQDDSNEAKSSKASNSAKSVAQDESKESEPLPQGGGSTLTPAITIDKSNDTQPLEKDNAPTPATKDKGNETQPPPQNRGSEPLQEDNTDPQTEAQDESNKIQPKDGGREQLLPQKATTKLPEMYKVDVMSLRKFKQDLRVFSAVMYSRIIQNSSPEENIFFSPASISHALGMLNTGAKGNTSVQIKKGLQMSANMSRSFIDTVFKLVTNDKFSPQKKTDVKVVMAARSYFQINFSIKDQYIKRLQKSYHSAATKIDFANGVQAAETINAWVEKRTNKLIKNLVQPEHLGALTKFVLVSALYFKASWENGFINWYAPMDFHTPMGKAPVPFLQSKTSFKRKSTEEFEYIGIPYKDQKMYYFIIMPKNDQAMKKFEEEKAFKNFFELLKFEMKSWKTEKISLFMPKFTTEMSLDLKKILSSMGITDVFSSANADLSGISTTYLYVSEFLHKARITVNKDGTEAAAATAVFGVARTLDRVDTVIIDRPFIFGVYENDGNILFMGKMVNPSEK